MVMPELAARSPKLLCDDPVEYIEAVRRGDGGRRVQAASGGARDL